MTHSDAQFSSVADDFTSDSTDTMPRITASGQSATQLTVITAHSRAVTH